MITSKAEERYQSSIKLVGYKVMLPRCICNLQSIDL